MCRLVTKGTMHGCGHYVITEKLGQIDCDNRFCSHSAKHKKDCPTCPQCIRYYGPDAKEMVTRKVIDYCSECEYWFKGPGRRDEDDR